MFEQAMPGACNPSIVRDLASAVHQKIDLLPSANQMGNPMKKRGLMGFLALITSLS